MKIVLSTFNYLIAEILVIFCFLFLINNYLGNAKTTINADAIGYYDYLPSIFIHDDLVRKDYVFEQDSTHYKRVVNTGVYVDYNQFKVNKYPCGVAFLQLPFFMQTFLTTTLEGSAEDGYQRPFQRMVFHSTLFYLLLTLLFFKQLLQLYNIKRYLIIFCQFALVFSTTVTHYANIDAGFSHVYSLFAITAFIYFVKLFFQNHHMRNFIFACLFFGLIFILRQPNILIILFVPFLAGSKENLIAGIRAIFANRGSLIAGFLLFCGIASIQSILWFLQTGSFFVYSYQGEGFNFLDPHFYSILFSYKKGLFVYTPVLFITLIGLIWLAYKKAYYLFFTWIFFFGVLTYVLSSWWCWYYGSSYGLRAYIDYYVLFFIPFALMLDKLKLSLRLMIMSLVLITIPINIIQTYQYKFYILHWTDMNKDKYWKVFLKTNERNKGLVWKGGYDPNHFVRMEEINLGDFNLGEHVHEELIQIASREIQEFDKVSVIQVSFDHHYPEDSDTKIELSIDNVVDGKNNYHHERYLIHFHEKKLNMPHRGFFNYEFNPIEDGQIKRISLYANTGNQQDYLKNVTVAFLRKR